MYISVHMGAALVCTTKLCLVSREGPWGKTKHSLVVKAHAATGYTDRETALINSFTTVVEVLRQAQHDDLPCVVLMAKN